MARIIARAVFFGLGVLIASVAPVLGQQKSEDLRAWPIFEQDGTFGFCLVEKSYADGRKLAFAFAPSNKLNIGLVIPDAGFVANAQYDLTLSLETSQKEQSGKYERAIRSIAIDADSLILQMGNNPAFTESLIKANRLSVEAAGKRLDYSLNNMRGTINDLQKCTRDNKKKTKKAVASEDLPDALKALLFESGLKNVVPLSLEGLPVDRRPADYMWQTGALKGGVRERLVVKGKSLSDLIGLYVNGLKKKCAGSFDVEIGQEEQAGDLVMRVVDVQCVANSNKKSAGENGISGALLFYITPSHRFTVFTHEGKVADMQAAIDVRDSLKKTIKRLAETVFQESRIENKQSQ